MHVALDRHDYSNPDAMSIVSYVINSRFEPVSTDWKVSAYHDFTDRVTEPDLKATILSTVCAEGMFVSQTAFDIVQGCGYLGPSVVAATHMALAP